MNQVVPRLLAVLMLVLPGTLLAQENDGQVQEFDYHLLIDDLVEKLKGDELNESVPAFSLLVALRESNDRRVRNRARFAVDDFYRDACDWLSRNAEILEHGYRFPKSWDDRFQRRFDVSFTNPDIEIDRLVYLRAINCGSVAFVELPEFADEHLICLRDQPNLVSLTLEKTQVTGLGFQDMQFPGVEVIYFTGSPVTDFSIRVLHQSRFPRLAKVVAVDTEVSESGVKRWKEMFGSYSSRINIRAER